MDGTRLMVKKELFTFECEEFIETEISGHLMKRNAIHWFQFCCQQTEDPPWEDFLRYEVSWYKDLEKVHEALRLKKIGCYQIHGTMPSLML
ncbi:hypothetical protein QL285_084528 [Trifolium repens]|jgi:hypothetical protein|nr:hypothetical protein QL285_084528 [Trifolium repens]